MHKLLARQLKRILGVEESQLPQVQAELACLAAAGASPVAAQLLAGLSTFFLRVDEAYSQADRDLELKTLSLELSSTELTQSNNRLREELASRTRAIDTLRTTAMGLMDFIDLDQPALMDDNLESLSALMSALVQQNKESQKDLQAALTDLAHQKFAFDQHAIVSITDLDGTITYANDKLCHISGYSRAELVGQSHRIINSGTHPAEFFANMWQTIGIGKVWHGELCNRAKDGHLYWVNATIVPLRDELGATTMYIAIRTDITERKRMESAIEAAGARLRRIANSVPGVVFQWHVGADALKYTFVSDRLKQVRGIEPHELLQDASLANRQILEEDFPRVRAGVFAAARSRELWHDEYRVRLPDGTVRWIRAETIPEPELSPEGATIFTGIWQDVTELKEADARLREVTENVPVAVFQYLVGAQLSLQMSFISQAIQSMAGIRAEDVVRDSIELLMRVHPSDVEMLTGVMTRAHRQLEPWAVDFRMVHALTKLTLWVHAESQPKVLTNGTTAWNGYLADITSAKQVSAELQKAKDDAEAASRAKSDFLANMSHEIRTPMNGVLGMTELLMDSVMDPEQREYLRIVKSSSEALLRVINDILDFSKIEAGKLQIEHIPFHLGRTVADTLKTLALRVQEKGLELVCEIAPGVPMAVVGDPGRLRQILVNIIGNAIKFTEKGGIVLSITSSEASQGHATLYLTVRDTGIGIPADKLGTIFEAFSQEDSSITRKYGGTGLGLTICARLAEALGGRIWVESEVGCGSVFHFVILVGLDESAVDRSLSLEAFRNQHVLVVDDNEVNLKVLLRTLQDLGLVGYGVTSGELALQWLVNAQQAQKVCSLVLLDAMMAPMDGFALAQHIRALPDYGRMPMLMLSSAIAMGDAQRARDVGIAAYLTKPIARDELLQAIAKVLSPQNERQPDLVTGQTRQDVSTSLSILLVEDHLVNQRLAITLLQRWGHQVQVANNGQIALDMVAQHRFDIILMDMMMPVMDGLTATRCIRNHEIAQGQERTPIIAMTANAMEIDRQRCLDAGMDDYISKPIKAAVFQQMLQKFSGNLRQAHSDGVSVVAAVQPSSALFERETVPFDYVKAVAAQDQELVDIVAQSFVAQWPRDVAVVRAGLSSGDFNALRYTTHALKGTLLMFGAEPASAMAAQMEHFAAVLDGANIQRMLGAFLDEVEHLLAVLRVRAPQEVAAKI